MQTYEKICSSCRKDLFNQDICLHCGRIAWKAHAMLLCGLCALGLVPAAILAVMNNGVRTFAAVGGAAIASSCAFVAYRIIVAFKLKKYVDCRTNRHFLDRNSCKCLLCGSYYHEFDGKKCVRCGKDDPLFIQRKKSACLNNVHDFNGCKCRYCDKIIHDWRMHLDPEKSGGLFQLKCARCGLMGDIQNHNN